MTEIFVSAQGKFSLLLTDLAKNKKITKISTIISDSREYEKNKKSLEYLSCNGNLIFKEWEIYNNDLTEKDIETVKNFEANELKGSLFKALVVDRRFFFGKNCKFKQDYKSRFQTNLSEAYLFKMASFLINYFNQNQPKLCLTFGVSTVQDYIIYKLSEVRKIQFRQLRSLKIKNYIGLFSTLEGIKVSEGSSNTKNIEIAKNYLNQVEATKKSEYEGAIIIKQIKIFEVFMNLIAGLRADIIRIFNKVFRNDNHVEWLFFHNLRHDFLNKIFWKWQRRVFFNFKFSKLNNDYFLYPLHFEPEVAIQYYGQVYLNQIELIRNISNALPLGSKLVIKEHPRSYGFRSNKYYKKIKEINRVVLLKSDISMFEAIKKCKGVFTISGSAGLNAVIQKKPCWVFGDVYYSKMGENLVYKIEDLNKLDVNINNHLRNFKFDKSQIINFLSKIIENAVPFNLYSYYLNKKNRVNSFEDASNIADLSELLFRDYKKSDIKRNI